MESLHYQTCIDNGGFLLQCAGKRVSKEYLKFHRTVNKNHIAFI